LFDAPHACIFLFDAFCLIVLLLVCNFSFCLVTFNTDIKISEVLTCAHVQVLNNNSGSGYDAPEVGLTGQYTLKSDVYSFGVVMLELLSGRKPFDR